MSSEDSGTVCRLIPIPDETDTPEFPIELRDHEAVVLGRSIATGIKDKKLSRHQVEVTADWTKKTLRCKQLGSNPSLANRAILAKDEICLLKDGQTLHLLLGRFQYRIEFSNKKLGDESFLKDNSNADQKNSTPSVTATNIPNSDPAEAGDNASTFKTEMLSKAKKRPMSTDDTLVDEKKHLAKRSKMEVVTDQDGQDQEEDDIDQKLEALRKQAKEYNNKTSMSSKSPATSSGKPTGERAALVEKKKGPEKLKQGEAWDTGPQWEEHGSLVVYTCDGVRAGNWIAGFDMDGTIITTQSGKVFPTSIGDWRILYPDIPGKLKKLHAQGYKVMFFTNQLGVGRGKTTPTDMKQKVTSIIKKLGVPIQVMMATGSGVYRKPAIGMWTYLLDKANDGISVDMTTSLYAGDVSFVITTHSNSKELQSFCPYDVIVKPRLAFSVSLCCIPTTTVHMFGGDKGYITSSDLNSILSSAFDMEEMESEALFKEVDRKEEGRITFDAFKDYATEKPEYAKLFTTYQEQPLSTDEEQPQTNGGTNHISDKKTD